MSSVSRQDHFGVYRLSDLFIRVIIYIAAFRNTMTKAISFLMKAKRQSPCDNRICITSKRSFVLCRKYNPYFWNVSVYKVINLIGGLYRRTYFREISKTDVTWLIACLY